MFDRSISVLTVCDLFFLTVCFSMLADDLKLSSDDDDTQKVGDTLQLSLQPEKSDCYISKSFEDKNSTIVNLFFNIING